MTKRNIIALMLLAVPVRVAAEDSLLRTSLFQASRVAAGFGVDYAFNKLLSKKLADGVSEVYGKLGLKTYEPAGLTINGFNCGRFASTLAYLSLAAYAPNTLNRIMHAVNAPAWFAGFDGQGGNAFRVGMALNTFRAPAKFLNL